MLPSSHLCPNMKISGICHKPSCPYLHDPNLICLPCNVVCNDYNILQAHLRGKKHRNGLLQQTTWCHACLIKVAGGSDGWASHIAGTRHQRALATTGRARPEGTLRIGSQLHCTICNKFYQSEQALTEHKKKRAHKKKERVSNRSALLAAIRETRQDKYNVALSHQDSGIDYGFIALESLLDAPERIAHICIEVSAPNNRLTTVRTNAQFGVDMELPVTLQMGQPLQVPVVFRPGSIRGRFGHSLEFTFENTVLGQTFSIIRTACAVVGEQSDHDAFVARIPYVRPKRRKMVVSAPIPGPPPASSTNIPYVITLPEYPMDPSVIVAGSEEQRKAIIQRILPQDLSADTYRRFWQTLLFVEEHQMCMDFEAYDMFGVSLRKENNLYFCKNLVVPGLAEKRPSVLVGDTVHVRLQREPNKWFEGRVHFLKELEVGLRFNEKFQYSKKAPCDVRFTVGRVPLRRMHQALHCAFFPARVVFPSKEHIQDLRRPSASELQAIQTFNPHISTNGPQLEAVTAIVNRPPGSVPFVIFGPPGTGKTVTLVEAILQILARDPNARILACTPSNSAADLITQRLADLGPALLFRMNAPSRWHSRVPPDVRPFTFTDSRGYFSVKGPQHIEGFRVVVSTCISAAIPFGVGVTPGHFTHVFVDEAGQAMEPEIMIPIKTISGPHTNIVLSGDPKQLGPIIRSNIANELGLGTSLLSRLMEREVYAEATGSGITMVKLTKNWRSHESIIHFSSDTFYGGDLQICASPEVINSYVDSSILASSGFPVIFHGIDGRDDREADSPSYFNIDELSLIVEYVERLRADPSRPLTDADIGIIAPYNAQGRKLRLRLKEKYRGIKVGSVEEFQGQERKVILITTVRSSPDKVPHDLKYMLGFLINPRRLNVALTRAKALMIIVGNPHILGLDPLWKQFLTFVYRRGGFKGLGPNWDTEDEKQNAQPTTSGSSGDPDLARSVWDLVNATGGDSEEEDFVLIGREDKPWREEE